jgi:hypothetical protein
MESISSDVTKRRREVVKVCSKIDKELHNLERVANREIQTKYKVIYPIKLKA